MSKLIVEIQFVEKTKEKLNLRSKRYILDSKGGKRCFLFNNGKAWNTFGLEIQKVEIKGCSW